MKEYRSNRTPPSLTARWRFPLVRDRLAMQLARLERAITATCTTAHKVPREGKDHGTTPGR